MKKALLTCLLIISSAFFASAQFQVGGANVNVGRVCGTISGRPACINPSTGQWEVVTGNGIGVSGNANTGQIGGSGTIGGVRIGGNIAGSNGAIGSTNAGGLLGLFALAQTLVTRAIPFLVGVALLAFFWFLIEFIWKGKDSPEEQAKAKKGIFWSIVALFVMVSIWGIVMLMGNILGIGQGGSIHGFCLPGATSC